MATKGDINATVGIGIKTEAGALKGLNDQINTLIRQVQGTVTQALKETDKMSAANVAKLREFSKAINQTENAIKVLSRYSTGNRKVLDFLGTDEQLQKQARAIRNVQEYRKTLEQASTTTGALKARINELDRAQVDAATKGKKNLDLQILQQQKLQSALKEYETVQKRISNVSLQAGMLSPASFSKLNDFISRAQHAQDIFTKMAGDRRVFNFDKGLTQLKLATAQMEQQVRLLAQQDKQQGVISEKIKQRARDLLATTPRMEQAQILSAGRSGFSQSLYADMKPEEFERRIGRATALYAVAKRQLQVEVDKGANADTRRLETLMGRYKSLQSILGQTSRAYEKLQADIMKAERQVQAQNEGGTKSKLAQSLSGLLGDGGLALGARVGIYALAANGIYGVMNAARDAARFVIEFEDKLASLQAISGSTNTQMEQLSRVILDVSKNSRFSAVEIADATVQLAQAGFSAKDLGDSLQSIVNFAAASGTSVKDSVDLVTGAIGAFQLQASEAGRITDIFTAALNRSRLTSQQIAQAIQYVGTTAYEQNISLEQMVATIGSVAQAGVRAGSTLGTGFRQFLVDLANPTDKLKEQLEKLGISLSDIDVKTRGLPAVLDTLAKSGFGAAQAYEGLEVRAAAFYLAAKNNVDISNQLMLAESQRNVALEASSRAMDSLSAQWQRFINIMNSIVQDNAPLDFFKAMVRIAGDLAEKIQEVNKRFDDMDERSRRGEFGDTSKFITLAKDAFTLQNILGNLNQFLAETLDIGVLLGREFGIVSEETKGWGQQWLEYANDVTGAKDANEAMATATAEARDEAAKQAQTVASVSSELTNLLTKHDTLKNDTVQVAILTNQLTTRFEGLAGMLGNTANAYDNLVIALRRYQEAQGRQAGYKMFDQAQAAGREFNARSNTANQQIAGIRRSAGYQNLSAADRGRLEQTIGRVSRDQTATPNLLSDLVRSFKGASTDLIKGVDGLRDTLAGRQSALGEYRSSMSTANSLFFRSNPKFNARYGAINDAQSTITALSAQAAGKSEEERSRIFAPFIASMNKLIPGIDASIRTTGNRDLRRELTNLKDQAQSAIAQANAVVSQTSEEKKAEAKADRASAAAGRKAEAEARREANQNNRNNAQAAQSRLTASGKSIDAYFADTRNIEGNLSNVGKMFDDSDALLAKWIENRKDVLEAAITKGDMNPDQIKEMTDAANEEIAAKQKDVYQKQLQAVSNGFTNYISEQQRKMALEMRQQLATPTRNLALAQGTADGLSNPLYNVPEYTQVIQGRRVALAQQAMNQSAYQANAAQIAGNLQLIDKLQEQLEVVTSKIGGDPASVNNNPEVRELRTKIEELTQSNEDLINTNDALNANINAQALKPKTLGEGLGQAATAFGIQNNIGIGLNERVIGGLGTAIDSVHASFQQFFTDVITGAQSVGQAFGGMAKAVIAAIAEMAAKAVATQIFGLLLSFIPGFTPSTGGNNAVMGGAYNSYIGGIGRWNGGMIGNETPKRLIAGGRVSRGLPTRDSTLVHAAQGEFMLRRSSVESIGEDLLNDMNQRGSAALRGLGDKNIVMPQSQLNSNVYVVLPEEKPSLGPADILAVVSRDVLRGGATKQLIKQVAAGG